MRNVTTFFVVCRDMWIYVLSKVKTKTAKTAKTKSKEDNSIGDLIARTGLAQRWKCHTETIRRKEKAGLLHPLYISSRLVRYKMSEVLALERAAMQ